MLSTSPALLSSSSVEYSGKEVAVEIVVVWRKKNGSSRLSYKMPMSMSMDVSMPLKELDGDTSGEMSRRLGN